MFSNIAIKLSFNGYKLDNKLYHIHIFFCIFTAIKLSNKTYFSLEFYKFTIIDKLTIFPKIESIFTKIYM